MSLPKLNLKKVLLKTSILGGIFNCLVLPNYGMIPEQEREKPKKIKIYKIKHSKEAITSLSSIERKLNKREKEAFKEPLRSSVDQMRSNVQSLTIENVEIWIKGAEAGHLVSLYHLGWLIDQKEKVKDTFLQQDKSQTFTLEKARAFYWWKRAQRENNVEAWAELGKLYGHGQGVEKNKGEAIKWYRKAAHQNHIYAQFSLAIAFCKGSLVSEDVEEANMWLRKSAEQGHVFAQYILAESYEDGNGFPQDYAKALKWYKRASEWKDSALRACFQSIYEHGWPYKNLEKGLVERTYERGLYKIGKFYRLGWGVEKDNKEALDWFFKAVKRTKEASLELCNFTDEDAPQVASLLAQAPHLDIVNLRNNKLTSHGLKHILESLQHHPDLVELDIRNNLIEGGVRKEFLTLLEKRPSLKKIEVSGNPMSGDLARAINGIIELRIDPTEIKQHTLISCDFTDEDAPQLASLLAQANPQNQLSLSSNNFTSQGLIFILKALSSHPNLRELDVSKNAIDDEGGKELLTFLKKTPSLKKIEVSGNPMSEDVARAINGMNALRIDPAKVSAYTFSLCHFTDEDAPQVASLLVQAIPQSGLSLSFNKFTSRGLTPILKALSSHPTLAQLSIAYNTIDDKGGKELLTFLEKTTSLKKIDVDGNPMSAGMENSIKKVMEKRNK